MSIKSDQELECSCLARYYSAEALNAHIEEQRVSSIPLSMDTTNSTSLENDTTLLRLRDVELILG